MIALVISVACVWAFSIVIAALVMGKLKSGKLPAAVILFLIPVALHASNYSITLAWKAPRDWTVAGYRVYYGGHSGVYTNTIEAFGSASCTVSNLAGGATYYFAVTDYDSHGMESPFSNEVVFTVIPPAPVLLENQVEISVPVIFWWSTNLSNWSRMSTGAAWTLFPKTNPAAFFFVTPASQQTNRLPAVIHAAP